MKNHIKTGFILLASVLFAACEKNTPADDDEDHIPAWNKSNTTSVCFISKLNGELLIGSESEKTEVSTCIKTAKAQAVILDRCDVSYGAKTINPLLFVAKELKLIPVFARNKLTTIRCEGSGILLPHTLREQEEIKISQDCWLKSVETVISASNKQKMRLSTICIQTEEHIRYAKSYLNAAIKQSHVIVGTVKSEFYSMLEKQIQESASSFRLEKITQAQSSSYQQFVLTSEDWILRDSVTKISGALHCVNLQIEQL